ncbi:MAG TPA: hypothetical protein PL029_09030, partial [Bacteroidia bacterium]|nr:hypothetical protein [Bacteroidia bacterium]
MLKYFLPACLFVFPMCFVAQKVQPLPKPKFKLEDQKKLTDSAFKFYEKGLKAFNEQKYREADSLYTISEIIKQHPDTYYNRALTRAALNDPQGYCEDICSAATMGDRECDTIFRRECGTVDTIYMGADNKPATRLKHHFFSLMYQSDYKKANIGVKFDNKGKFIEAEKLIIPDSTGIPMGETPPEFQGGIDGLKAFVKSKTKFPVTNKNKNVSGQVLVKFIVNRFGYPENISVVNGIENCPE